MEATTNKTYNITNLDENEFLAIRIGTRQLSVKEDESLMPVARNVMKKLDKISV